MASLKFRLSEADRSQDIPMMEKPFYYWLNDNKGHPALDTCKSCLQLYLHQEYGFSEDLSNFHQIELSDLQALKLTLEYWHYRNLRD